MPDPMLCGAAMQTQRMQKSSHSTTPIPTSSLISSRGSSRECRRVVQLAAGIISIARAGRVGEDPREEVGVVECELNASGANASTCGAARRIRCELRSVHATLPGDAAGPDKAQ